MKPNPFSKASSAWRRRARAGFKFFLGLAVGLLAAFMFFKWFEYRQVYHPTARFVAEAADLNRPVEEVGFKTADGLKLHGWFLPADPDLNSAPDRSAWCFLICHGNGGNISHRLSLYNLLLQTGANVLAFDYRGYGRSEGRPGEEGTYLDAQAAHGWLVRKGFDSSRIVAWGESLGGAVACELALREALGALVLHSAFTSAPDLGEELFPFLPVRWLSSIRYEVESKLKRIDEPVLIFHSREDSLIPFEHAQRNFKAAPEPKRLVEVYGDHNDQPRVRREVYLRALNEFWEETLEPEGKNESNDDVPK